MSKRRGAEVADSATEKPLPGARCVVYKWAGIFSSITGRGGTSGGEQSRDQGITARHVVSGHAEERRVK